MPFIAGFFLYLACAPFNRFLLKNRIPKGISAFLSLFLISVLIFFIIRTISSELWSQLGSFIQNNRKSSDEALFIITKKMSFFSKTLFSYFPSPTAANNIFSGISDSFLKALTDFFTQISTKVLALAKNIPSLLICTFVAFFTAFFLLKENETVFSFFKMFFGEKVLKWFLRIKTTFFVVFKKYIKAQLIITGIIFCVLLCGFLILKTKYALLFAFLIALVDSVPLFGTGTVLIPWAIYEFLTENSLMGWGLIGIYGAALLTRQLCEPKIVGKNLGIHPLLSILSIYLGLKIFGVLGLFFGPLCTIFIKTFLFSE